MGERSKGLEKSEPATSDLERLWSVLIAVGVEGWSTHTLSEPEHLGGQPIMEALAFCGRVAMVFGPEGKYMRTVASDGLVVDDGLDEIVERVRELERAENPPPARETCATD